jgi:hypothetical protein
MMNEFSINWCSLLIRVAGNAAYIIGTVAETDMGCYRILGLAKAQQGERKILADLTRMLTFDDSESVMNAAGTMGTLVSLSQIVQKMRTADYHFYWN